MSFNMAQWARDHETLDKQRFAEVHRLLGGILKVLAFAGTMLIAVLGWSVKTQYDGIATQAASAQAQLQAIRDVQARLAVSIPTK